MAPQRLTLDLSKNKELADLISDMEPGETIYAELSIVAKDDQSLTTEVEAVGSSPDDLNETDDETDEPADKKDDAESKSEADQSTEGANANPFTGSSD